MGIRDQMLFTILSRVKGQTLVAASAKIGVGPKTLKKWKTGETQYPTVPNMLKALKATGAHFEIVDNKTGDVLSSTAPQRRGQNNSASRGASLLT
jgi:hypothetical protein